MTGAQQRQPVALGSAPGRWVILLTTVLGSGMALLDSTVVNVALGRIGEDLDASLAGLQWTVNGYTLTLAALILLGGALGDRYGRRRVFVVGVVLVRRRLPAVRGGARTRELVAARVLQGIGGALLTPGSLALIQSSFRHVDRARAIGLWSSLAGIAGLIGPFLGGVARRRGELAAGVPDQRAVRRRSSWPCPVGTCPEPRPRGPRPLRLRGGRARRADPRRHHLRPDRRRGEHVPAPTSWRAAVDRPGVGRRPSSSGNGGRPSRCSPRSCSRTGSSRRQPGHARRLRGARRRRAVPGPPAADGARLRRHGGRRGQLPAIALITLLSPRMGALATRIGPGSR